MRLAVSVEGDTEEEFVNIVLSPHLIRAGCAMQVIPIGLEGNVSVDKLVDEMVNLMRSFDAVTSLVDFYGVKGKGDRTVDELTELVGGRVRKRTSKREDRILPYIQMHEFEGLLFSDVDAFPEVEEADSKPSMNPDELDQISRLRRRSTTTGTPLPVGAYWVS